MDLPSLLNVHASFRRAVRPKAVRLGPPPRPEDCDDGAPKRVARSIALEGLEVLAIQYCVEW